MSDQQEQLPSNLVVNKGDDGYYVEEVGKEGEGAFGFGYTANMAKRDYFNQLQTIVDKRV